jgi:OmcA/MtrC family decaheme c-type cytochrome
MRVEFDNSIPGSHVIPTNSIQLKGVNFEIMNVNQTQPGQNPVITYRITRDNGSSIQPSQMNSLTFRLAGPASAYSAVWSDSTARTTSVATGNGTYTYTFPTAIPVNATGTYAIGVEGYQTVTVNRVNKTAVTGVRDAGYNDIFYFPVTGQLIKPTPVVSLANCDSCHKDLALHGGSRKNTTYCILCHNAYGTDEDVRPTSSMPPATIDMKYMIHRIHLGVDQSTPYIVYGFRGSINDYSDVLYPGDLRDCAACHIAGTQQLPLPSAVLPTIVTENGVVVSSVPPTTSSCTACHDSVSAGAHATTMTTSSGAESCATCHGPGRSSAIDDVHSGIIYSNNYTYP